MKLFTCCVAGCLGLAAGLYADESGPELFSQVAARDRARESQLLDYSSTRTYEVRSADGHIQGESRVAVRYHAPDPKEFHVLEEHGSRVVSRMVFGPLMRSEEEASAGQDKHDSSIAPSNYDVRLTGEDEIDGRRCYILAATPRRRDKYLFEGTIWVDAQDLAVVQIVGQPAKNPSFWVRNVRFVRRYQKIGNAWLPLEDSSISDVRIFGRHTLTIRYQDYELDGQNRAEATAKK